MKTCCDRHADYPNDRGNCAMLNANAPHQLEFDLWSEIRVSNFDMVSGKQDKHLIAELYRRAYVYGEANVMLWHEPDFMHIVLRYRV